MRRERLIDDLADQRVVLIDVRPTEEFAAGHIPGAISIPADNLPARADELPRDRTIVAYCRGEYCLWADEAVAHLRERGFEAHRLEGGWPEWITSPSVPESVRTAQAENSSRRAAKPRRRDAVR